MSDTQPDRLPIRGLRPLPVIALLAMLAPTLAPTPTPTPTPTPAPTPTATPAPGTSVRVTSIPALLTTWRTTRSTRSSSPTAPTTSARPAASGRTRSGSVPGSPAGPAPVTVRAETRGGVTFDGGGATSFGGLTFVDGAHDQTWDGFNFANGQATNTGIISFGGYAGLAAPHHITLRHIAILRAAPATTTRTTTPSTSPTPSVDRTTSSSTA